MNPQQKSGKQYKDTIFRLLYSNPKYAIELCNALEGTNYPDSAEVMLCDLDNSLHRRYNDAAFAVENQLIVMIEQQSTINPNMPLRLLPFITDALYAWFIDMKEIYKSRQYKIPAPKFYVLYNGIDKLQADTLRLSDAFKLDAQGNTLELTVKVIDINYKNNHETLEKCITLKGYSYLVQQIRTKMNEGKTRDQAIHAAIEQCIAEDVLREFLERNFAEVAKMFTLEYDQKLEHAALLEEGREEGLERGLLIAAVKLIKRGMTLQEITSVLELTEAQVEVLQNSY